MHLLSCENPKVIYNKSLRDYVAVPCRKCDFCRNNYRYFWQQRLHNEALKHSQVVFFTLTYANDTVPTFIYNWKTKMYESQVLERKYHVGRYGALRTIYEDDNIKFRGDSTPRMIYYLRRKDVQTFMKRLRSLITYHYGKTKILYFICGEYGPKGNPNRPHYHGVLFFDSQEVAKDIAKLIRASWQNGFTNASFARNQATDYVSKYILGIADLPKIYENPNLKPFFLCSRKPVVGSSWFDEQKIKTLLVSERGAIPTVDTKGKLTYVQLPCSLENRYFPKFKGFGKIPNFNRVVFYREACKFFTEKRSRYDYKAFEEWIFKKTSQVVNCPLSDSFEDYVFPYQYSYYVHDGGRLRVYYNDGSNTSRFGMLLHDLDYFVKDQSGKFQAIRNLYNCAKNVCYYALCLDYRLDDYINAILRYYENKKSYRLKEYFTFQSEFVKRDQLYKLVNLDPLFKHRVFTYDYWRNPNDADQEYLEQFGLDPRHMLWTDGVPDFGVLDKCSPYDTYDYLSQRAEVTEFINRANKTKRKNDAILNYHE